MRCSDKSAEAQVGKEDVAIFPADEMTRQIKGWIIEHPDIDSVASVEPWYFEKTAVNIYLRHIIGDDCFIQIPMTFN